MYRTIPIRAKFSVEEKLFWIDQCQNSSSLINCAIYYTRQKYYTQLEDKGANAKSTYWRDNDQYCSSWKTYKCDVSYPELDKALKQSSHYKAMAAQSAQQTLKTIGESITSYNKLVSLYYKGEVDKPKLPKYRKKGGLAAVTFPRQALNYKDGYFFPSISKETKSELLCVIKLELPEFIDSDWVKELTIRPSYGEFWIDWVIDDGVHPIKKNPHLDYKQAWGFDHGVNNWLTGVSTKGKSFIINGKKLKSINQGYSRLVAKYKQGKSNFYWDENLDRIQQKRNNQIRDIVNKTARFIVNRCLKDQIGNLVIGWNERQKDSANMGKKINQEFVPFPTKRLIERVKQLCEEYGIVFTLTEESYTSKASFLDSDFLPKYGEKPKDWKSSGKRINRGLYKSSKGHLINADCNGACNILRKVTVQLGLNLSNLIKAGSGIMRVPNRYDIFNNLNMEYRKQALRSVAFPRLATSASNPPFLKGGDLKGN